MRPLPAPQGALALAALAATLLAAGTVDAGEQQDSENEDGTRSTRSHKPSDKRITRGEDAYPGQFPHQAGVCYGRLQCCGGSLISQQWVLTAAHCIKGKTKDNIYVKLGTNRLDRKEAGRVQIPSSQIIPHQDFRHEDKYQHHDIGLVKLQRPVEYNKLIQPVRLPTNEEAQYKHHGLWGQVSGWGANRTGGLQHPQLKWARLPVSQPGQCRYLDGPHAHTQFCTDVVDYKGKGTQGHDTCAGDSGSPYIADHHLKNTPVQLGIVSYGGDECGGKWPTVYTSVGSYLPWIKNHTGIGSGGGGNGPAPPARPTRGGRG